MKKTLLLLSAIKSLFAQVLLSIFMFYTATFNAQAGVYSSDSTVELKSTQAPRVELAHPQVVIALAEGEFFPLEYSDGDQQKGVHIEMLTAVAKLLNVSITYVKMPWKRAIYSIEQGHVDALTYIGATPERAVFTIFLANNVLSTTGTWAVVLKSRLNEFHYDGTIASLSRFTFAVGSDYKYGEPFDSIGNLRKFTVVKPTPKVLIELLQRRRVDIILNTRNGLLQVLSSEQLAAEYYIFPERVAINNNYIGFSKAAKNGSKWAKMFAAGIQQYKQSPQYQQLIEHYHEWLLQAVVGAEDKERDKMVVF